MPNSTNKKDNKEKKTTKTSSAKKVQAKKTSTKKPAAKKSETKATVKKVETKKVAPKAVEKKVETKKVEAKKVEKKVVVEKIKGVKDVLVEKVKTNTPFAIALCVIVVLLAALIFVSCSKRVPKTSDGKEVLATLKGKTITANDLYEQLKEDNGTNALISIVDDYISNKEVKVTDEDKEYVNDVVAYYKDYAEYYGVDLATFLTNYVGLSGINTEEEFADYVLNDYKKTLAVVKFIGDNAKEEDLKNYYKENYTDKLTVKHILVEIGDNEEEALNTAKNLINELNNTDSKNLESKFDELAKNNSDDTATYANGGLIENISKNDVVEEFWDASYSLKNGEYTKEPVKTTYGYHVILRLSSTKAEKYEDIKDEVKKSYGQSLLSQDSTLLAEKWDELRKQYKLSIKDDFMKETYEKLVKTATEKTED